LEFMSLHEGRHHMIHIQTSQVKEEKTKDEGTRSKRGKG